MKMGTSSGRWTGGRSLYKWVKSLEAFTWVAHIFVAALDGFASAGAVKSTLTFRFYFPASCVMLGGIFASKR